ncbi:DUF6653 family protein [Candidatus Albibeggiatoa sp. nov. BB20]|uniref:DUF6653 family protein n=1 Tax=Candidatus Albibeggiatoa sp. nov. BB20 TaxID=3162723 RepID=UPI003365782E
MSFEQKTAKWFRMSNEVWERHANPWSVWTRYSGLPLLIMAVWSRVWISWWSLIPIALVITWIWINPRLFSKPQSTNNWASKAVLGERILLEHTAIPIHHLTTLKVLKLIMMIGTVLTIYGLIMLHFCLTILGVVIVILGKSWFLDRMVWLYQDLGQ